MCGHLSQPLASCCTLTSAMSSIGNVSSDTLLKGYNFVIYNSKLHVDRTTLTLSLPWADISTSHCCVKKCQVADISAVDTCIRKTLIFSVGRRTSNGNDRKSFYNNLFADVE